MSEPETQPSTRRRLKSLDQFRGYTVAGMFLVNFLGAFNCVYPVLKHHNTYFSYADTIMPQFFFAVGFSMRWTLSRKLSQPGALRAYGRFILRCLTLVAISFVLSFLLDNPSEKWKEFNANPFHFSMLVLKADLWETLALIGVTSFWILPSITSPALVRFVLLVLFAATQMVASHYFLFDFQLGLPNFLDTAMGTTGRQVFDGGMLGFLTWSIPMLTGTLASDMVASRPQRTPALALFLFGVVFMALGYAMSCVTTCYNLEHQPIVIAKGDRGVAKSPVVPPKVTVTKENWRSYLAEPPFTPPRRDRPLNAWMMTKRTVSVSIMLFASGFSLAVYSIFAVFSDWLGLGIGVFRTLGTNALAAYVIHEIVEHFVRLKMSKDASPQEVAIGFAIFFLISYGIVRVMEYKRWFLRA